eukprot:m.360811 g.360811  ORF g.360811 m.360811 type:complete len:173 (-) comp28047_c1_seq4:311-829(-)
MMAPVHAGDVSEFGKLAAAAFAAPDKLGAGQRLSMCGDTLSWDSIVETLTAQEHKVRYTRVPGDVFDGFFPPAKEIRLMFEYFEEQTYFGPDAEKKVALADELVPGGFTSFAQWPRPRRRRTFRRRLDRAPAAGRSRAAAATPPCSLTSIFSLTSVNPVVSACALGWAMCER